MYNLLLEQYMAPIKQVALRTFFNNNTPLKIFSLRWDEVEKQNLCLPHYDHQEAKMISLWILPNTEVNPFWKKDFPTCIVLDNQEKHQEMKSINN